ncbi:hypothetical protein DCAR_0206982 [Daucus carota subsp. sativus]|uniref:RRM domain-containing protein n=1 Tax=Daucus carota subsp. sativus TaxID=79200 RepID=A0A166DKG0_DAUCS|nr:PREDICTED: polyadenylate-binding protein 4-like [Daucus carota subsp. sativus]XP_017234382.1 PREDICTED: polyadenylate-binding protein 4-like [Daucus carota subsp. sativus]WOG87751.1 hypothetical protein DCAR_0206982 [Daucus carota subsp. sativus]
METPMLGVANLDASVTDSDLYDHFSNVVGYRVIWAEVRKDRRTDQCLGDGHVCCNNHQQAVYTIDALNGTTLKGKTIVVTPSTFTFNEVTVELCVPPRTFNMEIPLRRNFKEFGKILLIKVYEDMFSNTYGSIIFDSLQSAASAANELLRNEFALCNMYYGGKSLVDPQFPLDIVDPSTLFCPPKEQTSEGFNVRVDNLYFFVTDQYLLEQFSPYGKISFCEVMRKPDLSNGSGRVTFSTREEAMEAIAAMEGKDIRGSSIKVTLEEENIPSSQVPLVDELEHGHAVKKPKVDNAVGSSQ